jgi:hypothetical protein
MMVCAVQASEAASRIVQRKASSKAEQPGKKLQLLEQALRRQFAMAAVLAAVCYHH